MTVPNYTQEINADIFGAFISKIRMKLDGYNELFSILGIYLGLKSIELNNKIENLKKKRDVNFFFSRTHPSFEERRHFFINEIVKNNAEFVKCINLTDEIIDYMWNEFMFLFDDTLSLIGDDFWVGENNKIILYSIRNVIYKKYPIHNQDYML